MSEKRRQPIDKPQLTAAAGYITIPVEEYNHLTHMANLLEIIMYDHTPYHDAVGIVKNVLKSNGLLKEAGVEE